MNGKQSLIAVQIGILLVAIGGPLLLPALSPWPRMAVGALIGAVWAPLVFRMAIFLLYNLLEFVGRRIQFGARWRLKTAEAVELAPYVFFAAVGCAAAVLVLLFLGSVSLVAFVLVFAGIVIAGLCHDYGPWRKRISAYSEIRKRSERLVPGKRFSWLALKLFVLSWMPVIRGRTNAEIIGESGTHWNVRVPVLGFGFVDGLASKDKSDRLSVGSRTVCAEFYKYDAQGVGYFCVS